MYVCNTSFSFNEVVPHMSCERISMETKKRWILNECKWQVDIVLKRNKIYLLSECCPILIVIQFILYRHLLYQPRSVFDGHHDPSLQTVNI